jgi:protein tyrosine/serine phosphatase
MKKFIIVSALLLLLCPAGMAVQSSSTDLPNFGTVAPGFYRGAAPTDAGLQKLKGMGVKTVIDLRISPHLVKAESVEAQRLGLNFVNLPMGADPPTKKEVATFLQLSGQAGTSPVYVHCQHGADRTGTMVGIYREVHDHWSFAKTYAEMRHYGFNPHWAKLRQSVMERAPK